MQRICAFFIISFLSLLNFNSVYAASSAEDRLKQIFKAIKSDGLVGASDYVHWETEYSQFTPLQKKYMDVSSVEEYRKRTENYLSAPTQEIDKEFQDSMQRGFTHRNDSAEYQASMTESMKNLSEEQKKIIKDSMAKQLSGLRKKIEADNAEIKTAEYEILAQDIDSKEANFLVKITNPNKVKKNKIKLVLINNNWYIPLRELTQITNRMDIVHNH